jgi:hypothetical protein
VSTFIQYATKFIQNTRRNVEQLRWRCSHNLWCEYCERNGGSKVQKRNKYVCVCVCVSGNAKKREDTKYFFPNAKQSGSNFYVHISVGVLKKTNGRHIKFIFCCFDEHHFPLFAAHHTHSDSFLFHNFFMMVSREKPRTALNSQNLLWRVCSSQFYLDSYNIKSQTSINISPPSREFTLR